MVGCTHQKLDIPPADISTEELPALPDSQPFSYVSAPIVFDYRSLMQEAERRIPVKLGSINKKDRIKVSNSPALWVAPELKRGPLEFTFEKNTVTVTAVFEYRANAWAKPFLVEIPVSCGMDKEAPRIRLSITASYDLKSNWHLDTHTRLKALGPLTDTERDQCEITFLHIDVTQKVADAGKGALEKALAKADSEMARISIQKPIEGLWNKLQTPISIAKGQLWFRIRPQTISLGPIRATDSTLTAQLDLLARPRMRAGERPPNDSLPLPALGRTVSSDTTADVFMEGVLYYEAANNILNKNLVGKTVGKGWKRVKIESVTARSAGKGRVLLGVSITGAADGTVWVVGTPSYDTTTDLITVPDLKFDVNSEGYLEKAAGWLVNGPLLEDVRNAAQIHAADLLKEVVRIINKEINRQLSEGIYLRGELIGARAMSVQAQERGVVVSAKGLGKLWLEIDKKDLLPKKRLIKPKKKKPAAPPAKSG